MLTSRSTLPFLLLVLTTTGYAQATLLRTLGEECGIEPVASKTLHYGHGAALADYDNDGDIDFYLTTDRGLPDRLYRNDGTGYFRDVADELNIHAPLANRAALWVDIDGDHLLDLIVAGENCPESVCRNPIRLSLYRQTEEGTFIDLTSGSGLVLGTDFDHLLANAIGGLSAGDLNGDGYLDLLLTVWGGGIRYYQNNGDLTFADRTDSAGLVLEQLTPWQTLLHDFNGDGLLDIYCNVDFDANVLWINQGDTFLEQAAAYGLASAFNEMGMAVSDYDNDGDLDLYLTNITWEVQGRQRHNVLYEQHSERGRPYFTDRALGEGVGRSGWDWGAAFLDIDNDGRQDLVSTNGWWDDRLYPTDRSRLWINTTAGFLDGSGTYGFQDSYSAATLLAFDKDRDGDMDVLQTLKDNPDTDLPLLIYENTLEERTSGPRNFLTVQPRMGGPNHYAIGSTVTLRSASLVTTRLLTAGSSFYGQEPAEAHFGLGGLTAIDLIEVTWPGGKKSLYRDLPINQVVRLDYAYLDPPTELRANRTEEDVELRWRDNSATETGFLLEWATDSLFSEVTSLSVAANATTHRLPPPEPGARYFYRISATNDRVASDYSNMTTVSAPALPELPRVPKISFNNPVGKNGLQLTVNLPLEGRLELTIFSLTGQRLWSIREVRPAGVSGTTYTPGLSAGPYLLRVGVNEREALHQLLIVQ